ncbi:MAG: hypothetical protein JNK25_08080 [Phycisphaerae bacterium]|nr:hypothetical protein [Phycisphaerae bacterium]
MRPAAVSLLTVLGLLACGCSTDPQPSDEASRNESDRAPAADTRTPTLPATPTRIDGFAGELVAIPLPEHSRVGKALRLRLDDGTEVPVKTYHIMATYLGATDPWLGSAAEWSAEPATTSESAIAVFTLPAQAAGQGLWIGETRHEVQWLTPPESIEGAEPAGAWRPTLPPAAANNAALLAQLRAAARSPLTRWRVRLLLDGMRSGVPPMRFDDPVIESWATYNEERWRVAFARLALADPAVCDRLRKRLSAVMDFGGGLYAPAWPTDQRGLDRFLSDVLSPRGPRGGVAARAEQFMSEQPQAVIWIVDDGGVLTGEGRRRPIPLIGVANLSGRDALAFGYLGDEPPHPDLLPVPSFAARVLTVTGVGDVPKATVRLSRLAAEVPISTAPLEVVPPGLRIGPLLPDLSMERWLYAQPAAAPVNLTTHALLHRPAAGPDGEDRPWELFVECRVPPGMTGEDRLCICIGPPGLPGGVVCVDAMGLVSTRLFGPEDAGPPRRLSVARSEDRWSFRFALPPGSIEPGGLIRLGLVRKTAHGRHAWPRTLLPWQDFPSRALIDISGWSGLAAPER